MQSELETPLARALLSQAAPPSPQSNPRVPPNPNFGPNPNPSPNPDPDPSPHQAVSDGDTVEFRADPHSGRLGLEVVASEAEAEAAAAE